MALVSGLLSFAVTTPQQQIVIALAPDAGPVVTSLYQSALYLAVSASGAVGAFVVDGWGGASIGPLAALFVLAAALVTRVAGRAS